MNNKIIAFTLTVLLSGTLKAQAIQPQENGQSRHGREALRTRPIKVDANSPMWERYLATGQQYLQKGDKEKAKPYLFEALSQLERSPRVATHLTGKIARLQGSIMSLYPNYPRDKAPGEGAAQIRMDEEEIAILTRLNRINSAYPNGDNNLPAQLVNTQIRFAQQDLKTNREQANTAK